MRTYTEPRTTAVAMNVNLVRTLARKCQLWNTLALKALSLHARVRTIVSRSGEPAEPQCDPNGPFPQW